MANKIINPRIYGVCFLASIIAVAAAVLGSIWFPQLVDSILLKVIFTLLIVAFLAATLFMYAQQDEGKTKNILGTISTSCAALLSLLGIGEIWFDIFNEAVTIKLGLTLVVVGTLSSLIMAIKHDLFEDEELRKNNYLD